MVNNDETNNSLKVGDKAPEFTAITDTNEQISLSTMDKNIVLFFYPKDNTPGCTIEARGFSVLNSEFAKYDTFVIGISKDNVASHGKFKLKCNLQLTLISDTDTVICQKYYVWKQKSFLGRKYMGTSRETFLIGKDKRIKQIWHEVNVTTHPQEVLEYVKKLS